MLSLLGTVTLTAGGREAARLATEKALGLLCYLAANRGAHARRGLAGLLWGGMPEERAQANLRMALYSLQKALPGYVDADRKTAAFDPQGQLAVDVEQFERLLAQPDGEDASAHVGRLVEATRLYRGAFMAGVVIDDAPEFEEWLYERRDYYQQLFLRALEDLAAAAARCSDWGQAIGALRRLLGFDPCREHAHRQLMSLLAHQGNYTAALKQYARCREALAAELGVLPMAETESLHARISAARLRQGPRLAAQPTALLGRGHELGWLYEQLTTRSARLITLLGPGGVGKTRIAVEVAARQHYAWIDGAYVAPLTGVADVADLAPTIAAALRISLSGRRDPRDELLSYLEERELLLVLDNFEHLLDGGIALVEAILAAAPGVQVLVTSRERLQLRAEFQLTIAGLACPPEQAAPQEIARFSAVQLYVGLARRQRPDRSIEADMPQVGQICRMLGGHPLGIELAAGLADRISAAELAKALAEHPDVLRSELHDIELRHRSLRAVFAHSWMLLEPAEQQIYRQLAIFHGAFTAEAAREIAGATGYTLDSFAGKSLLRAGAAGSYEMHEVLRHYSAEHLATDPSAAAMAGERHSRYYLELVERNQARLSGADPRAAVVALSAQFDNIRAAWRRAVSRGLLQSVAAAADGLLHYYVATSRFHEGEQAFATALASLPPRSGSSNDAEGQALRARLLIARADCLNEQSNYGEAIFLAQQAIELAGGCNDATLGAAAMIQWGCALWHQGWYREGRAAYLKALRLARSVGARRAEGQSLLGLGTCQRYLGNLRRARALYRAAGLIADQRGDWREQYGALNSLGVAAVEMGDYAEGRRRYEQALQIARSVGVRRGEADLLNNLGNAAADQGDHRAAAAFLREALAIFRDLGDPWGEGMALNNLGLVLAEQHDVAASISHYEQALSRFRAIGSRQGEGLALGNLGSAWRDMGDLRQAELCYAQSLALYRGIDDRLGEGQAELYTGLVRHLDGDQTAALERLSAALRIFRQIGSRSFEAAAQTFLGHALAAAGQNEQATAAYRAAVALRHELAQAHLIAEPQVCLALIALGQGRPAEALSLTQAIVPQLIANDLGGIEDPLRVTWGCYHVLATLHDQRSEQVLAVAQEALGQRLALIHDPLLRERFLERARSYWQLPARFAGPFGPQS